MPNQFVGLSLHQKIWIVYFILTAIILTVGIVIAAGVETNSIRVDKQQTGRVIYVGCICTGLTAAVIGITFIFIPRDPVTNTTTMHRIGKEEKFQLVNNKKQRKKIRFIEEIQTMDQEEEEEGDYYMDDFVEVKINGSDSDPAHSSSSASSSNENE